MTNDETVRLTYKHILSIGFNNILWFIIDPIVKSGSSGIHIRTFRFENQLDIVFMALDFRRLRWCEIYLLFQFACGILQCLTTLFFDFDASLFNFDPFLFLDDIIFRRGFPGETWCWNWNRGCAAHLLLLKQIDRSTLFPFYSCCQLPSELECILNRRS